jgi:peptide/nickel transport system substrate-binding protein
MSTLTSKASIARLAAGALALALSAGACTGGGSSSSSGGKGVIVYGYDFGAQFTGTFSPAKSTGDCDQVVTTYIYDTLVHKDAAGNLHPGLAVRWQVDPPGNQIELWIRPGVRFSDGEVLDGQAVINGLQTNATNDQLSSVKKITSMKLDPKDPLHVTLGYVDNTGIQLPYAFVGRDGEIMSTKQITSGKADTQPIGAGPFMLTSYQSGSLAQLRPNPNYWDKANSYKFGGIDFKKVGTGPPTVTALESGDINFARIESDGYASLQGKSDFKTVQQPTGAYMQFEFRIKTKDGKTTPFAKKEVRQAIEYGLDRKRINQAAQDGLGEITDQPFPTSSPSHIAALDNYYTYNVQKAKDLLKQAGYPNGFAFTMTIPGGNIANMEHQAVEVQQELKQIGITANILRILPSEIATGYYISQKGDAFSAEELASGFPGGSLDSNYSTGQYVATWDGAERQDMTDLMKKALSQVTLDAALTYVHQAVTIAVKEALDVPIAFAPQLNAYATKSISGPVGAQTDICDPPNLSKAVVSG